MILYKINVLRNITTDEKILTCYNHGLGIFYISEYHRWDSRYRVVAICSFFIYAFLKYARNIWDFRLHIREKASTFNFFCNENDKRVVVADQNSYKPIEDNPQQSGQLKSPMIWLFPINKNL